MTMTRAVIVSLTMPPSTLAALDRHAAAVRRSRSATVAEILAHALPETGVAAFGPAAAGAPRPEPRLPPGAPGRGSALTEPNP